MPCILPIAQPIKPRTTKVNILSSCGFLIVDSRLECINKKSCSLSFHIIKEPLITLSAAVFRNHSRLNCRLLLMLELSQNERDPFSSFSIPEYVSPCYSPEEVLLELRQQVEQRTWSMDNGK